MSIDEPDRVQAPAGEHPSGSRSAPADDPTLHPGQGSVGLKVTPSAGRVIAAFPATGKSYFAAQASGVIDSDSSSYPRTDAWPENYVAEIDHYARAGGCVLVSTHAEVRAALVDSGIPFSLVYPTRDQREDYRERMKRRGSPEPLIRKVIDELWDDALAGCAAQAGCDHIVLRPGEYLLDALIEVAASNHERKRLTMSCDPIHVYAADITVADVRAALDGVDLDDNEQPDYLDGLSEGLRALLSRLQISALDPERAATERLAWASEETRMRVERRGA